MSQQSIENINYDTIYREVKKSILRSYTKKVFKQYYALGSEQKIDQVEHDSMMYDILKNANCNTIDLINALQKPGFYKTKYKIKGDVITIEDQSDRLYKIWLSKGNSGDIETFYNDTIGKDLTIWEDVEW